MRLTRSVFVVAGASSLVLAAAGPALACNDNDPALKLNGKCAEAGQVWVVNNPNTFQIPFFWTNNLKGQTGSGPLWAPAQGSIVLPTHGSTVKVIAFKPDTDMKHEWLNHGDSGSLTCLTATPTPTKTPTAHPTTKPTHSAKPTTPPKPGPAPVAAPVTKTPTFTG